MDSNDKIISFNVLLKERTGIDFPINIQMREIPDVDIVLYSNSFYCDGKNHGVDKLDEFKNFDDEYLKNNKDTREYKLTNSISNFSDFILKSPTSKSEMLVYRCIKTELNNKEGDILKNLGFMYTQTEHFWYDFLMNGNKPGIAFIIRVPKGTNMIIKLTQDSGSFDNEIIFDHRCQLLITKIEEINESISYCDIDSKVHRNIRRLVKYKIYYCDLI